MPTLMRLVLEQQLAVQPSQRVTGCGKMMQLRSNLPNEGMSPILVAVNQSEQYANIIDLVLSGGKNVEH